MPAYCSDCRRCFVNRRALLDHWTYSLAHAYICERCDRSFNSEYALWQHLLMNRAHWRCQRDFSTHEVCDFDGTDWLSLCDHWDEYCCHHYCADCGLGWLNQQELKDHQSECVCQVCSAHLVDAYGLKQHIRDKHSKRTSEPTHPTRSVFDTQTKVVASAFPQLTSLSQPPVETSSESQDPENQANRPSPASPSAPCASTSSMESKEAQSKSTLRYSIEDLVRLCPQNIGKIDFPILALLKEPAQKRPKERSTSIIRSHNYRSSHFQEAVQEHKEIFGEAADNIGVKRARDSTSYSRPHVSDESRLALPGKRVTSIELEKPSADSTNLTPKDVNSGAAKKDVSQLISLLDEDLNVCEDKMQHKINSGQASGNAALQELSEFYRDQGARKSSASYYHGPMYDFRSKSQRQEDWDMFEASLTRSYVQKAAESTNRITHEGTDFPEGQLISIAIESPSQNTTTPTECDLWRMELENFHLTSDLRQGRSLQQFKADLAAWAKTKSSVADVGRLISTEFPLTKVLANAGVNDRFDKELEMVVCLEENFESGQSF